MKKLFALSILLVFFFKSNSQCLNTDSLYTNNITHENALANWTSSPISDHYIIHYRELGTTNWSNLGNIGGNDTTRNIPLLQQLTTYEWQIKTFCDSTNQPNSGWSVSDTFTTTSFVPAPFAPTILPIIANFNCNMNTAFTIVASQAQDEPDISSTIFTSDKGHFEINTLNSGDIVGNASYSSGFLNFNTSLEVDYTLGPNYAKIDMIDSLGVEMGFFVIENDNGGIKVSSLGPFDGNNYTSGYISQINFTDLFVNPNSEGSITFTADINSELGDVLNLVDSSIYINCQSTNTLNIVSSKKLIKVVDVLGRESKIKNNRLLFYIYSDGIVEKRIIME